MSLPAPITKTTKTWSDLPFWDSKEWEQVREVIETEENLVPPLSKIFRPLLLTPVSKVRVLFLLDRPTSYSKYELDGLPLSITLPVQATVGTLPLVTRRLLEGVKKYTREKIGHVDLTKWAEAGVLLWHATPTTIKNDGTRPHGDIGWDELTLDILRTLYEEVDDLIVVYEKDVEDYIVEASLNTNMKPSLNIIELPGGSWYSEEAAKGEIFKTINGILMRNSKNPIDFTLR